MQKLVLNLVLGLAAVTVLLTAMPAFAQDYEHPRQTHRMGGPNSLPHPERYSHPHRQHTNQQPYMEFSTHPQRQRQQPYMEFESR
jgi:hypothetical protein